MSLLPPDFADTYLTKGARMSIPTLSPAYLLAAVTTIVGLFLSQGLVSNNVSKLVTGLAAIIIPAAFAIAHALFHGRVTAARITANVPPPKPPA